MSTNSYIQMGRGSCVRVKGQCMVRSTWGLTQRCTCERRVMAFQPSQRAIKDRNPMDTALMEDWRTTSSHTQLPLQGHVPSTCATVGPPTTDIHAGQHWGIPDLVRSEASILPYQGCDTILSCTHVPSVMAHMSPLDPRADDQTLHPGSPGDSNACTDGTGRPWFDDDEWVPGAYSSDGNEVGGAPGIARSWNDDGEGRAGAHSSGRASTHDAAEGCGYLQQGNGPDAGTGVNTAQLAERGTLGMARKFAGDAALRGSRHKPIKLTAGVRVGRAPAPQAGARVTVTMQDGKRVVYHTGRRDALQRALLGAALLGNDSFRWLWHPSLAYAGLLQFPTTRLNNTYYLVRAGEGQNEAERYILTNPVQKTSMDSGLSTLGKSQVVRVTAPTLKAMGAFSGSCWLWPSINQRSYQTAEILASLFSLGQSRIVPEYSFLDSRGFGALEGQPMDLATAAVREGDRISPEWRPPRGTDGTPNESVSDVLVRVRQVMSITETQYRQASVVIISPDSDNLSILQAALLGEDLRRHADFGFQPGEVRGVQLSAEPPDETPRCIACPRPPNCI